MPIFGTTILSFIPSWNNSAGMYAIQKCAELGFDMLEIILPPSMDFDPKAVKKQLAAHGISARCSLILPSEYHLPLFPLKAGQLIKTAIDKVYELEGDFLGGVLYAAIGKFTGNPCSPKERNIVQAVLQDVAEYAAQRNITLGIEPVNRYESYVLTAAEEVLQLIDSLKTENIGLHLDTFHMNIEELNFYDPIIQAGKHLKHMHITESDRGMLGEGNVHWDDLFEALSEINYQGPLVLENFSSQIKELVGPTSLWRPSKYNSEALAKGSLEFMKQKVDAWYPS